MSNAAATSGVIFDRRNVRVTREIAQINGTTYPINGIGSVRVAPPRRFGPLSVGLLAVLFGIADYSDIAICAVALAFGFLAFFYAWLMPHTLIIHTASSDRPHSPETDKQCWKSSVRSKRPSPCVGDTSRRKPPAEAAPAWRT